jgi:sortase A
MQRTARLWIIASLVIVGAWQVGGASYIYAKAWLAQGLIAAAWSQTLSGEQQVLPWPWADTWPIARLRILEQNVDLYVLSDASGRTLAFGPGLLSGSAMPGEPGNAIISAHRDTHFRFLRHTRPGAALELQTADGRWQHYMLNERHVLDVRRDRLAVKARDSTLTLMTCYPFDALLPGGPLRFALIAERVPQPRTAASSVPGASQAF